MKLNLSVSWTILALTLAGCATKPQPPPSAVIPPPVAAPAAVAPEVPQLDPALLRNPADAFTLGPGDVLEIEYIGEPASRATVRVGPDGKIYYYLLPGLDVTGLTLPQARELIAQKSEKYLRKNPAVALTLRSVASQRIWVLGQLNNPGVFTLSAPITLLEAVAEAGGPTPAAPAGGAGGVIAETADLKHSFILRHGQMLPVDFEKLLDNGDPAQNIYLQPGDFVYVAPSVGQTVHVMGAVTNPRAVTAGALTLVQTVASAGGTLDDADLSHVAIVRGSLTHPTISIVDYRAVIKGRAPDVMLEPHDIVYVPYSPYRTLTRYTDLILNTFVRTVGVNEGARVIDPNAGSVSVNVGIAP
jgi:protein involved in polysaccharide export with SLBB domain